MTRKAKVRIMAAMTLLMGIGFVIMGRSNIAAGCVILGCIWVFHIVYFIFGIKTIPSKEAVSV